MNNSELKGLLLKANLENFVINPDHPMVLDGPDAIVNSNRYIIALFLSKASDKKNIDYLLSRVGQTRLVYPNNLICIYVLDDGTSESEKIKNTDFDYFLNKKEIRKGLRLLDGKKNSKYLKFISEEKRKLYLRGEIIEYFSRSLLQEENTKGFVNLVGKFHYRPWRSEKEIILRDLGITKREIVFANREGVLHLDNYKRLISVSFLDSYTFQDGVPYLERAMPKVINYSHIPEIPHDPNKVKRVLNIFGWFCVTGVKEIVIEKYLEKIESAYVKRV